MEWGGLILLPQLTYMNNFLMATFLFVVLLVYYILRSLLKYLMAVTPAVNLPWVSTMPALPPMSLTPAVINDSNSRLLAP